MLLAGLPNIEPDVDPNKLPVGFSKVFVSPGTNGFPNRPPPSFGFMFPNKPLPAEAFPNSDEPAGFASEDPKRPTLGEDVCAPNKDPVARVGFAPNKPLSVASNFEVSGSFLGDAISGAEHPAPSRTINLVSSFFLESDYSYLLAVVSSTVLSPGLIAPLANKLLAGIFSS